VGSIFRGKARPLLPVICFKEVLPHGEEGI